jgi:alpha-tubulin suppressor-like RCC1 family protein
MFSYFALACLLLCIAQVSLANVVTFGQTLGSGRNSFEAGYQKTYDYISDVISERIASTSSGQYTTLFVTESGKLFGTGLSSRGSLGKNTTNSSNFAQPTPIFDYNNVIGGVPIKMASAGEASALVLTTDGKLFAFGSSDR